MRTALKLAVGIAAGAALAGCGSSRASRHELGLQCAGNLTTVSFAAILYSNDHHDTFPRSTLQMSNEIVTPKVLICPADIARTKAVHGAKVSGSSWSTLTTNDFTYTFLASEKFATNSKQLLFHCPWHQYSVRADGRVFGRDGQTVPNLKFPDD